MEKNIGMQKHAGKVGNLYFLDSFKTPTKINLDMVDGMTLVIQKKKNDFRRKYMRWARQI